jgi:hypothetical protein
MAKKSKRQSRRSNDVTRTSSTVAAVSTTSERDFNPDYSNTIKDLRRIGILAGTFISILFILAFFLR